MNPSKPLVRLWHALLMLATLLYALPLTVLLVLRTLPMARLPVVALFDNTLPMILFPAPVLLLLLVLARSWRLVVWTLPGIAALILWYGGYFLPGRGAVVLTDSDVILSVLTYNARTEINDIDALIDLLRVNDADLVALQEFRDAALPTVLEALADVYPHHAYAGDLLTLSQHPITSQVPTVVYEPGSETDTDLLRVTVAINDDYPVAFYNFHPLPPIGVGLPEGSSFGSSLREDGYTGLLNQLQREEQQRVILAGDFNATDKTQDFQRVMAVGFQDTFGDVGRGLGLTFPNAGAHDFSTRLQERVGFGLGWVPPLLRIDFVLHNGDGLRTLDARPLYVGRSDHYPVLARVALTP